MKKLTIASFLFSILIQSGSVLGFTITPMIGSSGQGLIVECGPDENTSCRKICGNDSYCEVPEPYCRSCAGTQNLRLKRILDDVGNRILATATDFSSESLVNILASREFITLHPKTLYNYSSVFDGAQIRSQFLALCEGVSDSTGITENDTSTAGILLLKIDPITHQPIGIHGAVCNFNAKTEFDNPRINSILYRTNHHWQILQP